MSYLDVPRLHFAGTFTANPSTINNNPANYNSNLVINPPDNEGLDLSWNPYGSHAWTINAQVTSFVDNSGQVHTGGDPLIGAPFGSYVPENSAVAKLVDLDTEQQGVTRLFGLNLQLTLPGSTSAALQGLWDDGGTLINLWLNRVPSGKGDSAAGGAFQSVLQNLQWANKGGSALLQQLQDAAGAGLSVRFSVYGYQDNNTSSSFRIGSIMGTIGPQLADEPLHLPPRLLVPTPPSFTPKLAWAPAKVNSQSNTVTIDLGNSLPDQSPGGPPANIGTLEVAVLSTILGSIDYQGTTFQQTAGVVQFPITAEQAEQPLSVLADGTIQLLENAGGLYIDVDGSSVYMNPGVQAAVNIWATEYGTPAAGIQVPLALVPTSPPKDFDNNQPASALSIPASVTTGANGSAPIPLQASNPSPLPAGRKNIGGQLYYIGGSWAAGNVWNGDSAGFFSSPLSVKLFNSIEPPITEPTWTDVQPILYKYYYLYAYMASIVDLSNYDAVKSSAQAIQGVLTLGFDDPNYMPVTREMSNDERQLILTWIANGCPQGNNEKKIKTESLAASADAGSTGAPPRRPWSGG